MEKQNLSLQIDGGLRYPFDFELDNDRTTKNLVEQAQKQKLEPKEVWDSKYKLPSLKVLHKFASDIYDNYSKTSASEIKLISPWRILYCAKTYAWSGWKLNFSNIFNGFYGELYFNTENNYLLLAIKGTSSAKNIRADVNNVTFGLKGGEIDSAFTFAEKVRKLILKFKCKPLLLITGHSLGGYLAQIITYTITYCYVDDCGTIRSREEPSEDFFIYTVVFDSPAAFKQICSIDPHDPIKFERLILPITNFVFKINLVNSFRLIGPHLGQVLALKGFEGSGEVSWKDWVNNTRQFHGVSNFANIDETELRKVCYLKLQDTKKYNCNAVPWSFFSSKDATRLRVYCDLPSMCKDLIGRLPKFTLSDTEILIDDSYVFPEQFIPQVFQLLQKSREFLDNEELKTAILTNKEVVLSEEPSYSMQRISRDGIGHQTQFESAIEFAYELKKGNVRFSLISSNAGMGKSITLKKVAQTLQKELPHYLIVHLNLYAHQDKLRIAKEQDTLTSKEKAVEFLKNLMLAKFKDFELLSGNFDSLAEKKKIVMLLDSFDEICPFYQKTAHCLIDLLRKSEFQVVVTTRPQEGKVFSDAEIFQLEPLSTWLEKERFIKNQFKFLKKKAPFDTRKWLASLTEGIKDDFWSSPLSLVMAVFIYGSDIHNGRGSQKKEFIYREFLNQSIEGTLDAKFALDKNKAACMEDYEKKKKKYQELIATLAICTIFNFGEVRKEFQERIAKNVDFINRFDLVKLENKNVSFQHKSYAEYLVAREFVLQLHSKKETLDNDQLKSILLDGEHREIRSHICGILASLTNQKAPKIDFGKEVASFLLRNLIEEDAFELYMLLKDVFLNGNIVFPFRSSQDDASLLYLALKRARREFVQELIKDGANFGNILNEKFVLHMAVEKDLYDQVQFHIQKLIPSLNKKDNKGYAPLHYAARSGSRAMAEFLIEKGADIDMKSMGGSILHCAIEANSAEIVDLLISKKANMEGALSWAAQLNRKALFGTIYEKISDHKEEWLREALLKALEYGVLEMCTYLCDLGANPMQSGKYGDSCAHLAAVAGHLQCVQYFLEGQETVDVENSKKETVLMKALSHNHEDVVEWLLLKKADIHKVDIRGASCLHFAAESGNLHCVEMLVDAGAKIDVNDYDGCNTISYAGIYGNSDVINYLVGKLANLDIIDDDGNACLHNDSRCTHLERESLYFCNDLRWIRTRKLIEELQSILAKC